MSGKASGNGNRAGRGPNRSGNPEAIPRAAATMLGVQHTAEEAAEMYEKIQTVNGHTFSVFPATRFRSKSASAKFASIVGSVDPIQFDAERFDNVRERLQVADKREKDACLQAIAVLYSEHLAKAFVAATNTDCAEIERMFYPDYMPTYNDALRALGLKRPWFYTRAVFATLENISRMPLENCNDKRQATMSFAEYYSLLWNYHTPFNTNAFVNLAVAQSFIPTKELVENTADYLAWRHSQIEGKEKKNPILFTGARTGRFAQLLNNTKKIPVPIVAVHEKPNSNPYLLVIPPEKQALFKPAPIITMKTQAALEKYEPSMVLMSDFTMHQDDTAMVRAQGCVREYVYFGMADSYAEGNGWDTWGYAKYRVKGEATLPPFLREGWVKVNLHHLSRWMIHKNDSDMMMGIGSVTSFVRDPLRPKFSQALKWKMARLRPFL
ncbi:Hypothetical protein, putative [Bodo saltans]|uniref:Uncharacterized protein n=1 Tax=Bodo saltans TaxID=75058 RepID=A0A0S4JF65_BODSA|nr:Hypothetical protein, putative [Bodo saltans]|eukprot:CUG88068.1 Hypothetical protein, putative [Bodo saltans]